MSTSRVVLGARKYTWREVTRDILRLSFFAVPNYGDRTSSTAGPLATRENREEVWGRQTQPAVQDAGGSAAGSAAGSASGGD